MKNATATPHTSAGPTEVVDDLGRAFDDVGENDDEESQEDEADDIA
jgi:hypothetical protein